MDSKTKIFIAKVVFVIGILLAIGSIFQINQYDKIVDTFGYNNRIIQDQKDDAIVRLIMSLIGIAGALYFLKKNKNPDSVSSSTHVKCPDCAELVRVEAKKCKHCGAALDAEKNMQLVKEPILEARVEKRPNLLIQKWRQLRLRSKILFCLVILIYPLYSIFEWDITNAIAVYKTKHLWDDAEKVQSLPKYVQGIYSDNKNKGELCSQDDKYKISVEANRILRYEANCSLKDIKKHDGSDLVFFKMEQVCMMEGNESKDSIMITFDKTKNRNILIGQSIVSKCK
jgi:hypothetical protein